MTLYETLLSELKFDTIVLFFATLLYQILIPIKGSHIGSY